MRYLIIGLGFFGENLARDLTDLGNEVIGADNCQNRIDAVRDYISTVYLLDSTEETSLSVLPLKNVDVVVVAIGENFGASIRTVALLKQAGVKHIYARATDAVHEAILQGFHVDRILQPEQRAALDITHEIEFGPDTKMLSIDDTRVVARLTVPSYFVGIAYRELNIDADFGLSLLAANRPIEEKNFLGMSHPVLQPIDIKTDTICRAGDIITIFGSRSSISKLRKRTG